MSEQESGETVQSELGKHSPSWVQRKLNDETTPPEWSEHYEWRETTPYEDPKWTRHNGWQKWHAARDCGAETVYITEDPLADSNTDEGRAWTLRCGRCGGIRWDEVLFLHRDWYSDQFHEERLPWKMMEMFGSVHFHPDEVLRVGGVPSDDEVRDVIRRSHYEREAQARMAPPMPWEDGDSA